jgi:hypothetical protein
VKDVGKLGTCCEALKQAMFGVAESFFRIEDNGILYLTIGYIKKDAQTGFYDSAVLFCPFCGKSLQSPEEIRKKSKGTGSSS